MRATRPGRYRRRNVQALWSVLEVEVLSKLPEACHSERLWQADPHRGAANVSKRFRFGPMRRIGNQIVESPLQAFAEEAHRHPVFRLKQV